MDVAGLVSSIITFVDFSWSIVRGTYDVHRSASGATEENVHIRNVIEDLRDVTDKMSTEAPGQGKHEKALFELAQQCHELSNDLADILRKLTTKRRSGLQSLNIMLRSLIKEQEVREIEKRLGEYRGQMILRLNLMLITPSETSDDDKFDIFSQAEEEDERQRRHENSTKLSDFIEHSSGVFFLRGKPGSGKSTLMKNLTGGRGREKADQRLRKWAGQKRLIRVSTMFLLHGTPLQRSLEGFYRTLFFELICQCPDFVGILFPKRPTRGIADDFHGSSFRLETLREAWTKLISIRNHSTLRICVFTDGLDELEGNSADRLKFARTLIDWAESEDIKIIASGRPNTEFNIVFDQPNRRIDLQDLTRADIRKILTKRFDEIRHLNDLAPKHIKELVKSISNQSEGVILWAVLVGKNLEDDIIHGTPLSAMKHTIQALPSGIEDLYNDMWQDLRGDPHQRLMLRSIYELLTLYHGVLMTRALSLFWLEDALSDDEFPYNEPIEMLQTIELNSRLDKVRGQLIQYTKHFVEVTMYLEDHDARWSYGVCQFIHRSAQEFIQSMLGPVGSAPAQRDRAFDLDLRLSLMFEMSAKREYSVKDFGFLFTRALHYPNTKRPPEQEITKLIMSPGYSTTELKNSTKKLKALGY
ncbi:hypothetical protein SLS63_013144 [Diaporthe eres]|uniref:Nephrocystin 3-like N-terminal domain-containing protein n=1 Tax=Diaporthe eres TaxID=83184 RepID=A0ABR1NPF4_DIAER